MRGTTLRFGYRCSVKPISTHVPRAGHDHRRCQERKLARISTHVPRAGHDSTERLYPGRRRNFNSRAPCGARPTSATSFVVGFTFQLTCPVRGTTTGAGVDLQLHKISTHVPRAGHDIDAIGMGNDRTDFNSRAPCGARPYVAFDRFQLWKFQLTCPVRGTTQTFETTDGAVRISTHVPHAGHDRALGRHVVRQDNFNSRAPCGARQYGACCGVLY